MFIRPGHVSQTGARAANRRKQQLAARAEPHSEGRQAQGEGHVDVIAIVNRRVIV